MWVVAVRHCLQTTQWNARLPWIEIPKIQPRPEGAKHGADEKCGKHWAIRMGGKGNTAIPFKKNAGWLFRADGVDGDDGPQSALETARYTVEFYIVLAAVSGHSASPACLRSSSLSGAVKLRLCNIYGHGRLKERAHEWNR